MEFGPVREAVGTDLIRGGKDGSNPELENWTDPMTLQKARN